MDAVLENIEQQGMKVGIKQCVLKMGVTSISCKKSIFIVLNLKYEFL